MHLPDGFLLPRLLAWLNYFRFDGTQYRSAGSATIRWDDEGRARLTPQGKRPQWPAAPVGRFLVPSN